MSKTIEEAAREYDSNASITSENFYPEAVSDAFGSGAEYIMSLPLHDRLTAEEKERVRKMYNDEAEFALFYQKKANSCFNQQCKRDYEASRDIAKGRAIILKRIFGADFFKEGE